VIVSTHAVICTGCGLKGPASDVSPGLARAAAKREDWTLTANPEPGQREPVDLCGPCSNAPKET
jgi:hypothetical protein